MAQWVARLTEHSGTLRRAVGLARRAAPNELRLLGLVAVIGSLATAGQLAAGKQLVDVVISDDATAGDLAPWLIAIGIALVVSTVSGIWLNEMQLLLTDLVMREATGDIVTVAARAEAERFERPGFHDELERARLSVQRQSTAVVYAIVTMATSGLSAIAVLAVVAAVAPILVPVAALAYIPLALAQLLNNRGLYSMQHGLTELDRDRQYHEELLTGRAEVADLRTFALTSRLRNAHRALFDERIRRVRRLFRLRSKRALAAALMSSAVMVTTITIVMTLAVNGSLSVGAAAVAVVGFQQLADRFRLVGNAMGRLHEGVLFLDDFERFMAEHPGEDDVTRNDARLPADPSRIIVDALSFRYPESDQLALEDVSLELHRGEVVAIVGPNGSGKSTLARLLTGVFRPTGGRISWDSIDVSDVALAELRSHVAPVFQDVTHFQFSVSENIRFGDLENDDPDAIVAAAEAAGVSEFAPTLPDGFDTRLGKVFQNSTDLSVGQWQRVATARAFFRNAPLVVLDEPAAAVDPKQEADLFDRLRQLGRDRITVFVSHRFSTVRSADRVLVLDGGRVRETGTHDELMRRGDLYAEMFTLQASRYRTDS